MTDRFSRILTVEDNPAELRLLCDIFEEEGLTVVGCATAAEAIERTRQNDFGVAVIDRNLPDLDGVELLGKMLEVDPEIRAIIYTGAASFDSVKQALNCGAFAYIEKLSDPGELVSHVHRARSARVGRYAADLETAVARRTEELARSNQELQSFASVVAHDLRSPLLTISGYCEILKEEFGETIAPDAVEYLSHIVGAVQRMSRLIEDLLDYSRVGRGRDPMGAVDLNGVLKQACDNLDGPVREAGATVEVGPLPTVAGDQTQLVQLFQNLIGNALKFRGAQPPHVRVRAEADGRLWQLFVEDNGEGIDPKDFERIFQVFQRLHGKDYPGTGIGLALCKKIVERHGGKIWLTSEPGRGTAFFFTLPPASPTAAPAG